ncbi:Opsin Rh3 [Halotydeus destructor]|nr:Opsin Rh3 [Halotydeus destructor]
MAWVHFINDSLLEKLDQGQGTVSWSDLLDSEVLKDIPEHWLTYPPPSRTSHYVLGLVYIVLFVIGMLANGTIIVLYIRCRSLRTPSNYLILNLAASDFLMILKTPIFIFNSFNFGPSLGHAGCQVYGFVGGLSGTSAIMTIAFMALERYLSIRYPFRGRINSSRALVIVGVIWTYSFTFASIPLFKLYSRYVPEGFLTSCTFDYLARDNGTKCFIFIFFFGAFCCPLTIIVYSYVGIVVSVRASEMTFLPPKDSGTTEGSLGSRSATPTGSRHKLEVKLAKMSAILVSLWVVSWAPYATVALIGLFGDQSLLTPLTTMTPALFAKMAALVDPFIYGHGHPRFREQGRKMFCPKSALARTASRATMNATLDHSLTNRRTNIRSDISADETGSIADQAL